MAVRPARAVALSRSQPNVFARELFDGLPRRYDVLEAVLSFGQNHRWRTAMVDAVVASPRPPRRGVGVGPRAARGAPVLAQRPRAPGGGGDPPQQKLRGR